MPGTGLNKLNYRFDLLALLQLIISYVSVRCEKFRKFTTANPTLLYYNGGFINSNMRKERLNEEEVLVPSERKKSLA